MFCIIGFELVRKKTYYKRPDYKKLIVDLVKKKYLSLITGFLVSFLFSFFIYNQFLSQILSQKISQINLKKINLFFLNNNKKAISSLKENQNKKKEKQEKDYQLYTVSEGDSLSSIAQKFYGDLYRWQLILNYNNLVNPDLIEVGMVLKIPKISQ